MDENEEKCNLEKTSKNKPLVITRIFDAPRKLVWKAWIEPEHMKHWWGPKDYSAPHISIDFRVGGSYLYCMRSPEGKDYWSTGVYQKIVEPERIVCTDSFSDEDGNIVPASHYEMPGDWPLKLLVTVTFKEHDDKTEMTLQHAGLPSAMVEPTGLGWEQSFDKLAEHLASLNRRKIT